MKLYAYEGDIAEPHTPPDATLITSGSVAFGAYRDGAGEEHGRITVNGLGRVAWRIDLDGEEVARLRRILELNASEPDG